MYFCRQLDFYEIIFFSKNSFSSTIRLSNTLDPGQSEHFDGSVKGPKLCTKIMGR